jgi:hypothetical protein
MMQRKTVSTAIAMCLLLTVQNADARDLLLKDKQSVLIDMTSGPSSKIKGSRGDGKFRMTYRANSKRFGPTRVRRHTDSTLVFRGKRTTCTLRSNKTVQCRDGSRGNWR